jgi:hypothetical protein
VQEDAQPQAIREDDETQLEALSAVIDEERVPIDVRRLTMNTEEQVPIGVH